uniref:Uncharacterized protein n=1 Tax=Zea mays TaxID=4577 RepID=B4G1R8_MAIZE|nr:unknown [Zea mays]
MHLLLERTRAGGGEAGGAGAARAEHVERRGPHPGELRRLRAHAQGGGPGRDLPPDARLRLLRRLLHQPAGALPPHRRDHLAGAWAWAWRRPHPGPRPPRDRSLLFPGTPEARREGEVRSSVPAVAEERGRVQHRRPLPGAGAVGPRTELLGEDFGAPGQVSARGRAQCSEPGTCCHLFGWGASCIRAWDRSSLRV